MGKCDSKPKALIFGSAKAGEEALLKYGKVYKIIGFIDNNPQKWGNKIGNIVVYNPNEIKKLIKADVAIIIASQYYREIVSQLRSLGISNFFYYKNTPTPLTQTQFFTIHSDEELLNKVNKAAQKIYDKLLYLDFESLCISDYNKNYLKEIFKFLDTHIYSYSYITAWLLFRNPLSLGNYYFLEYGGGTGLISLLAAELGIGHIYYNDIYDVSCKDAQVIANALGYEREGIICGDLNAVIEYCHKNKVKFNGIASNNVIEHVYNICDFLRSIDRIAADKSSLMMGTDANSYNEKQKEQIIQHHNKFENEEKPDSYGWKKRDTLRSFRKVREEMVRAHLRNSNILLSEEDILKLSFATRGQMKQDIEKSVDIYISHKKLPEGDIKYPSNTCDPFTGNMSEHLMDFEELLQALSSTRFKFNRILPDKEKLSHLSFISIYATTW